MKPQHRAGIALAACLQLSLGAAPAWGQAPAPAAEAKAPAKPDASADTGRCPSVVMRNCRPSRSASAGAGPRDRSREAPARWEAVRSADPDADEILVEETRLGHPEVREVFERYLGAGPAGYLTRNAAGGARCTTIASTGATFCSHPGLETPGSGLPHTDFADGVF